MTNENIKGHLAAIATNVIFGLNITMSKSLLSAWMTPMGYTITRLGFGGIMFWTLSLFQEKEKASLKDLAVIILGSFLGIVVSQAGFAFGLKFTTPAIWSLLQALSPVVVLLLSALFMKEVIVLKKAIGVLLGISGAALIILNNGKGSSSSGSFLGIGIAVVCVISYAAYMIIMRRTSAKYAPVTQMKWMFLFAVIVLLPFGLPELPKQRIYSPEVTLLPILQLGFALLFSTMLGFFLMPVALKRIKATSAIMYVNVQPLVASTAAIIAGQDVFTWDKPIALLLVIAGVYMVTLSKTDT
jgi:drug/metabolite transporter (DMT)-like permease